MATSEIVVNEYLAGELRKKYPAWGHPDIISCEKSHLRQRYRAGPEEPYGDGGGEAGGAVRSEGRRAAGLSFLPDAA